ncbi:MAG: hypothetical protein AAF703_11155 [Cyanobacteria bacterium P01_D01_bin.105]
MTSQKDQIQSLIADIEQVLGTQRPKKPWVRASDMEPQRRALAKVQAYLQSLEQSFNAPEGWGPVDPATGQLFTPAATERSKPQSGDSLPSGMPEDVLQSLLTEIQSLRSSTLEPLRLEMDSLRQEREVLKQEVKGLEVQREALDANTGATAVEYSSISEDQLNEFLSVLMERLQERLSVQVVQTLGQLESDHAEAIAKLSEATDAEVLQLRPAGQSIEEMRELQSRSDQLLVNIESTLQGMYETLQKNIDSYQISLNEGIENMHSLGRQGEVIVRSLVDHLTQQLGQTTLPEPAFFPPRSAEGNVAYALADSPDAAISSGALASEALSTADADDESADDTVSSLNEVMPESATTLAVAGSDEVRPDEASLDAASPDEANAVVDEADQSDITLSNDTRERAPEDCIREDGTIDLDLLKLDIDRDEDEEDLSAEDVMVDAAIADAQVAANEAEDLEIEAKVTPTADAAYLAELTLDDLTRIEGFSSGPSLDLLDPETDGSANANTDSADADSADADSSDADSSDADSADAAQVGDAASSQAVSDADRANTGGDAVDSNGTIFEVPFASDSLIAETDAEANAKVSDVTSANPDSTIEAPNREAEPSSTTGAAAMTAAALGAAAAVKAQRSPQRDNDTEPSEDPGFWDSSVIEVPDSAKVPDVPDAQDEETAATSEDASLFIDDTVSSEMAAELEENSLRADQIAASAVRSGLEAVSTLTPDLEEPIVSDAEMPEPQRLADDAEPMESSQMPDWPEEAEEAIDETLSTESITASIATTEPTTTEITSPEITSPENSASVDSEIDAESTLNLSLGNLSTEPATATLPVSSDADMSSAATAPEAFDDELDFFEDGDAADKAADSLIEKLSSETLEDEALPDLAAQTTAAAASTAAAATAVGAMLESTVESSDNDESDAGEEALSKGALGESDTGEADPGDEDPTKGEPASWFLGIDIGTTGLSAVLMNRLGEQVYPLYWRQPENTEESRVDESRTLNNESEESQYGLFRLPAVLQVNEGRQDQQTTEGQPTGAVGIAALQSTPQLRIVKPLLKVGIPQAAQHSDTQNSDDLGLVSGPMIQWSDQQSLPLQSIQAALTHLLSTLSPQRLDCQAIELKKSALRRILGELDGVAVGYPNNWPDTYSFNVREAILEAGIVSHPDKIFFVEEAIAALLSALPDPQLEDDAADNRQPSLYNCNWQGGTVIISAGASLTEAGVVNLPADLDQLTYRDFALRSFTYAGDGLDQDIICQLLHVPAESTDAEALSEVPTQETGWLSLGLEQLQLPQAGEADKIKRHRLRQRLNDSQLGREVLAAARELKIVLQEETQCELTLAGQSWVIKRKDLETKVFIPYIQRVNRQLNSLLNQKELSTQAVKQVICTGGSAALGAIARWLRQKFPNATIIQDTYSGEYSNSCSRVAYGLANLCNYPAVLDTHRHQYNDYFLLLELLRVLPAQPLPAGGILHLLEQRGVNIQACQSHILALIEGHLPPGLVPTEGDRPLISAQSPNIETYRALSELPLFRKQGGQIYIADEQQGARLRQHLEALLSTKHQTLSEALAANLVAEPAT